MGLSPVIYSNLGLYCQHQLQDIFSLLPHVPWLAGTCLHQHGHSAADHSLLPFRLFSVRSRFLLTTWWFYRAVVCHSEHCYCIFVWRQITWELSNECRVRNLIWKWELGGGVGGDTVQGQHFSWQDGARQDRKGVWALILSCYCLTFQQGSRANCNFHAPVTGFMNHKSSGLFFNYYL